jgi:two-component system, OmpR family, sensor histidine kinase VicK
VQEEEEKTKTIYGMENTVPLSLSYFARAKQSYDSCGDFTLPSVIMTTEPIRNAYLQLLKRGIKTRLITEITEDNIAYCKELMNIVHELRHLEGIKVNFSISESDYVSSAIQQQEGQCISQLIHSNARAMIEQQQYFFETLWDKATSAEQRISEIEEGTKPEVIQTIREPKAMQEHVDEMVRSAKEEILIIFSTPNAFRRQEKTGGIDLLVRIVKSKGVKVRMLLPIDDYVRNVIDKTNRENKIRIDIRNIEETFQNKVSVLIVDRASSLSVEVKSDSKETIDEAIGLATYSNSKPTVLTYVSIFESLWSRAILAKQRTKEIEEGAKREFVETIRDPSEIQKLGFDLIKKAEEEILVLFSTSNAFRRQEKEGSIDLLKEEAKLRDVTVRILVPIGDNETVSERIEQIKDSGIDIRTTRHTFQNKLTTLIVDQTLCLTVEPKDDSQESSDQAIGLATYSNSNVTVFSYVSIFENLWIQTQMHNKKQVQEAARSHSVQ